MIIQATNIVRTFTKGSIVAKVLRGIDLVVEQGEWVAIMGKSGAGKSTLMYQLSLLDHPTDGTVILDGTNTNQLHTNARTKFRLENLGYVFQDYALLPELTATENVMVPLMMMGTPKGEARKIAQETLTKLGFERQLRNRPSALSGGEQQRVSIARAIAQEPKILFADEPTANLDSVSSQLIIDEFKKLHDKGQTIVMVTHEKEYTEYCNRIIHLEDGMIEREEKLR